MARYLGRRAAWSALMLGLISVMIFIILRVIPGDPTITMLGNAQNIDPAAIARIRAELGLDQPLWAQYWSWVSGVVVGDFGSSYFSGFPVETLIGQRVLPTVTLAVSGLAIAVVLALIFAVTPSVTRSKVLRQLVSGYTVFGLSAPPFVIGIIFIVVFAVWLGWLPAGGYDDPRVSLSGHLIHLALPAITLGLAVSAPLIRYLQGSMADVESAIYVRTAIAKGIGWRSVVTGHVLPNALLPALTALGVSVGTLLGGVVVVEYVFVWPGLGSQMVDAVFRRDYAVIQSIALLAAFIFILTTLVVDILYGVLDPRLRVAPSRKRRR